jgi:hypothetical protein
MKTILKILAALSVFAATQAFAVPVGGAKLGVLNQFTSKAEPTAKDAVWTSPTMFKVGVIDNKSDPTFTRNTSAASWPTTESRAFRFRSLTSFNLSEKTSGSS